MPTDRHNELASIKRFDQLVRYLHDRMGWPIDGGDFEELTFEYTPEELGIDTKNAAKIQEIKRLRPLVPNQPWGIFFVKFEPKKLPVVALRRILSQVALKKRASSNSAERTAWAKDDLLFVSNYGEGEERRITFAHFSSPRGGHDLPALKVIDWDEKDTPLHLEEVSRKLTDSLAWPDHPNEISAWRERWRGAFTLYHREVVTTAQRMSIRLAELARSIRDELKKSLAEENERGRYTTLMKALQEALVHDLDADGFADMYAQTIAYGLLSARIADPHKKTADDFAAHMRTNPFLRELMETFLKVGGRRGKADGSGVDFDELGVSEVVDLLDDANMEAVVRDFGDKNPQEDPVIRFYEDFLREYDPNEKKQRGVFYTPRPVVTYIVRSVDEVLRTEFGLADGLADTATWGEMAKRHKDLKIPEGISPDQDFLQILDPATGTGTFLVEAIDLIHKTLVAKWETQGHEGKTLDALWNEYVPLHLLPRLHGYELLMAPYAIAHLKIGLKLYETGYRFGSEERARVYLTNALEPASDSKKQMEFKEWIPAVAHESQAVDAIKRSQRFTVVVGNPPYAGHSSNSGDWARGLVDRYRRIDGKDLRLAQGKWLQNDYVKFIALAETTLGQSGQGVLGLITDHSYLDGDTFPGLRHELLRKFGCVQILDLHGNLTRRESPPDGGIDENVFDIQQGVAITLAWNARWQAHSRRLLVADLWGDRSAKFTRLQKEYSRSTGFSWQSVDTFDERYLFVHTGESADSALEYEAFDSIETMFSENGKPAPGFLTTHDGFAVAFTKDNIVSNVEDLLASKSEGEARKLFKLCSQEQWKYGAATHALRAADWRSQVRSCTYRPFDHRWTVYNPHVLVHRRERVNQHLLKPGNMALLCTRMTKGDAFGHVFVTDRIVEVICLSSKTSANAFVFPLYLLDDSPMLRNTAEAGRKPNLSPHIIDVYRAIAGDAATPRAIFYYCYAILHSGTYRARYNPRLVREFPRIPRPASARLFQKLALSGQALVTAHLGETCPSETRLSGTGDGVVAPGMPKFDQTQSRLYINKGQYFDGIDSDVWEHKIGSYEVCRKWLSERRGRRITDEDASTLSSIIGAIHISLRERSTIDKTIEDSGGWPAAFKGTDAAQGTARQALKVAESPADYGAHVDEDK